MKIDWKNRKNVIAGYMAVLMLFMSIPLDNLYAETEFDEVGTATICIEDSAVTEVEFTADELQEAVTKILTVEVCNATGDQVEEGNITSTWLSEDEDVATVVDGEITPIGAGKTTITYEGNYTYTVMDGDEETTVTGVATASVDVEVYEKPKLEIIVNPSGGATYPQEVEITVAGCPEGITPKLLINEVEQEQASYIDVLDIGTYTIEATTEAQDYYEASSATLTYEVSAGGVDLTVTSNREDAIYYSEVLTYEVTTGGIAGTVSVSAGDATIDTINANIDSDNTKAIFNVTFQQAGDGKEITFGFIPDNENYDSPEPVVETVNVLPIPVEAYWNDAFTKTYDGEATYPLGTPNLRLYEVSGLEIHTTVSYVDADKNYLTLDSADAGEYEATYAGELSLANAINYELVNETPVVTVTVNPIILSEMDNVNLGAGTDKYYDGESTVLFAIEPSLIRTDSFVDGEFENLTLGYTADYCEQTDNGYELIYGEASTDIEANGIRIMDLKVLDANGDVSKNYIFPEGSSVILSGDYMIKKNSDFEAFVDLDLGEPVDGVYWFKEPYTLEKEGYEFSIVSTKKTFWGKEKTTYNWEESLTINKDVDGKNIAAGIRANVFKMSSISDEITIGYDDAAPVGNICASVDDGESVSITELTNTYNTIQKGSVIEIIIGANDASGGKSGLKEIEWYGTDAAISVNDATTWPTSGTELITVDAEKYEDVVVTINKTELKKFYYAKITDNAGNVAYVSSSGVLQDISAPAINAVTLGTADVVYDDVNVYEEGVVTFAIDMKEEDITSGISDVKAVLSLNDENIAEYTIKDAIWTVSSGDATDAVTSIRNLNVADKPTDEMINSASGELSIEGTLEGLADGNAYTLAVTAYDKAGNEAETVSQQFIVDTAAPSVTVDLSQLNKNEQSKEDEDTPDGLFTSGKVVVTVEDMTLVTDMSTLLTDIKGVDWKKVTERNGLVTYTAEIPFGKGTVNADAIYSLLVEVEDSLSRTASDSKSINVDGTAPVYKVTFSATADNAMKVENTNYYNRDIIATFEIVEDGSYDDSLLTLTVQNAETESVIQWKNGAAETVSGSDFYVLQHDEDGKEFTLGILADASGHSTDNSGYTFTIEGQDKAGNTLVAESADNGITETRVMDTIVPDMVGVTYDTIDAFTSVSSKNATKDYVNADTTVSFALVESNPIFSSYSLTSEGGVVADAEWTFDSETSTYFTSLVVPQLGTKGDEQIMTMTVYDVAGNAAIMSAEMRSKNTTFEAGTFTDKFTVDKVVPTIKYEYLEYSPNKQNVSGVDYFNHAVTVQLTINEHNFNETLIPVSISKYGAGVTLEETDWVVAGNDVYIKKITFAKDSEYYLEVSGVDCANNPLGLIKAEDISASSAKSGDTSLSVALDQTLPTIGDDAKPVVVITPDSPVGSTSAVGDYSEHDLYNDSIVYEVTVYDPKTNEFCSGIDEISFNVTAENGATATATVNTSGEVSNDSGISVAWESGDATKLAKGKDNQYVFHVTIDEATFNSNNIVMTVDTNDLSTNKVTKTTEPIAIDITAPVVNISYDNDNASNETYFNAVRIATIEVTERNFSNDCISFVVNGEEIGLDFSCDSAGSDNRDDAVWRATYAFEADKDYVVECSVHDKASNTGEVSFSGVAPQNFTIDRTAPVISLAFDNEASDSELINAYIAENYYAAARTALITVEEHNFDGNEVEIIGTATDDGATVTYPTLGGWSTNGDVHVARIYFENDAKYTLDIAYTDMASNEAVPPETSTFVIDNSDPEIVITGVVDGEPYADEVVPRIEFADTNYEYSEIILERIVRDNHDDVTETFVGESSIVYSQSGRGTGVNTIEDIPHIAENDGIYTLTVRAYDKSGRSNEMQVTYSVNRFGSVYVYSSDLVDLIGGYHTTEGITGNYYIEAYNANALVDASTKLQITCDGAVVEGQKSEADVATDLISNEGWYVYRFQLDEKDFAKEGSYEITLSDQDIAGNTRTNSDEPIQFYIDDTPPMLDSVVGLEEAQIDEESKTVEFVVSDGIGLANISVFVNDELVTYVDEFENNTYYEGSFVLGSGLNQKVVIKAMDRAGNGLDTSVAGYETSFAFNSVVTVSTNALLLWYSNTALFWGSIAGIVGVGILGITSVIVFRRRKIVEE